MNPMGGQSQMNNLMNPMGSQSQMGLGQNMNSPMMNKQSNNMMNQINQGVDHMPNNQMSQFMQQ